MDVLNVLHDIFHIEQNATGNEYISALAKNIGTNLNIKYILIGRPSKDCDTVIQTDTLWTGEEYGENFEYELKGTPCLNVMSGQRVCIHSSNVAKDFPEDLLLDQRGIEGYAGAPIVTPEGNLIGLLVALDNKEIKDTKLIQAVLEISAARIGSEFSKLFSEEKLRGLNKELEDKLDKRSIELAKVKEKASMNEKMLSVTTLATGVAHELKNPYHLVVNSVEVLRDYLTDQPLKHKEAIFDCLNIIEDSTSRSVSIIESMLQDKEILTEQRVPLSNLVQKIVEEFSKLEDAPSFEVELCSEAKSFFVPETSFHRVLSNIISNAVYAIYQKKNTDGKITIKSVKEDSRIKLTISDNGAGMTSSQLKKVYEPFYTTKPTGEGTGLGMYMVYDILSSMRSTVSINSTVGAGTDVALTLVHLEKTS